MNADVNDSRLSPSTHRDSERALPSTYASRSSEFWWALAIAGIALRLLIAFLSIGTQDTTTWAHFGLLVRRLGVLAVYETDPQFNHPPVMGLYAALMLQLHAVLGLPFGFLFKLVPVVADGLTMLLITRIWSRRRGGHAASRIAALYAWALVPILVSAYHGNTDALCAFLAFLAAYLIEEHDSSFGGGLALAAAINVKLIPLLLLPAFIVSRRPYKLLLRFTTGFCVGLAPFAPVLTSHATSFYRHAVAYQSNAYRWGVRYLLRYAAENAALRARANLLEDAFATDGRQGILLIVGALCASEMIRRRFNLYELCALALSIFLVVTPGFGVQYLIYPCAFLFVTRVTWGLWYSICGGTFLASVYLSFFTWHRPWTSIFTGEFPPPTPLLGFSAWLVLARVAGSCFFRKTPLWADPNASRITTLAWPADLRP